MRNCFCICTDYSEGRLSPDEAIKYHGGNTIGHTCAVDRVGHILSAESVDRIYQHPYSVGRQPISQVSVIFMARSKAIILVDSHFA